MLPHTLILMPSFPPSWKFLLSFPFVIITPIFPNNVLFCKWWEMEWHVWHCVIISFKIPCWLYIFSLSLCKFPPLTFPSWCFPLKTAYFIAFYRQGSSQFDLFIPPCSITPCQLLRLMSKVMTDHHLLRLRYSGGLVGEAKVVITRGKSLCHHGLIQLVVSHQLSQQGIPWADFISRDFFTQLHPEPEAVHEEGGPSHQPEISIPRHMASSPWVTYQKGHRTLFAAARRVLSPQPVEGVSSSSSEQRVLSPHQVEGASLSSSAQAVREGKQPMVEDEAVDAGARSPSSLDFYELIREREQENLVLQRKLEMAQWTITYLEQRNKQLETEKELDELWRIRTNRDINRRRPGDPLPKDRELLLIRENCRLEGLLDKANRDKELLRNMKTHYWARLHVSRARMKILQRKLSEARKRKKRTNPLRILAEASLTHHSTDQPWSSIKMWKFWRFWSNLEIFGKITGFSHGMVSPRVRPFWRTARNFENLAFLERACKKKNYQYLGEAWFWVLSLQKLKIHQKNDFLPTFWVAESDLGRNGFWGVKSAPNSEIPLGMESRQAKLSNEPSCTWFGPVEPTQKQLWRCATKTSGGATKSSSFARIDLFGQKTLFWLWLTIFTCRWRINVIFSWHFGRFYLSLPF